MQGLGHARRVLRLQADRSRSGFRPILQKTIGTKEFKLVYDEGGSRAVKTVPVAPGDRARCALDDEEILTLARWGCAIEDHYSRMRGTRHADGHRMGQGRDAPASCSSCRPVPRRSTRSSEPHRSWSSIGCASADPVLATGRSVGRQDRRRDRCASFRTPPICALFQTGRSAGHRQDGSRLGADHEEGGGHRHQPRRPHLPRGDRQPRARRAGHRRHRARHRQP